MLKSLVLLVGLVVGGAGGAQAECVGRNLIADLPAPVQADLSVRAAAAPYASGLLWQAQRGDQVLTLIGTYHFDDARHVPILARLDPLLAEARLLLVEGGPAEEAALKAAISRDPALMFTTTGPTLPERMEEGDWQRLAAAMDERGVPPFLAAKFQPWYAAATLALSPCAMAELAAGAKGLDGQVIARAEAMGLPVRALEPYDTVLRLFEGLTDAEEIDLILASLPIAAHADDYTATLADAYFAEDIWLIWEFTRADALANSGMTPEQVAAQFALSEELLMTRRNRAWMAVILPALEQGPVVLAAGALHLPGETGLLRLLEAEGFAIRRLPL